MVDLYFAYGSNMDADQMAYRGLPFSMAEGAVLEGYRLNFDFPAFGRWLGGAADVVRDEGSSVEGVLYWLEEGIGTMDAWEGGYRRLRVPVKPVSSGEVIQAWTYEVVEKGPWLTPSEVYVSQMMAGARRFGLSEGYQEMLRTLLEKARRERGDHLSAVRTLATHRGSLDVEGLASAMDLPVARIEAVISDLSRWGWVEAFNEPMVLRVPEAKSEELSRLLR